MAQEVIEGLREGGITGLVSLPDSMFGQLISEVRAESRFVHYACAREDEGVAVAIGMYLGGGAAVCVMEGSRRLTEWPSARARAQAQRTPVLVLASHTDAGGEVYDYHASSRTAAGILAGLQIPYVRVTSGSGLREVIRGAAQTALSQRSCFGVLFAPSVFDGNESR